MHDRWSALESLMKGHHLRGHTPRGYGRRAPHRSTERTRPQGLSRAAVARRAEERSQRAFDELRCHEGEDCQLPKVVRSISDMNDSAHHGFSDFRETFCELFHKTSSALGGNNNYQGPSAYISLCRSVLDETWALSQCLRTWGIRVVAH
jgi:hypothetical protein